jgi:hypothetical protein
MNIQNVKSPAVLGWSLGGVSILALLSNWGVVGYMALQNDPGSARMWMPLANHPKLIFGLLAVVGFCSAIVATRCSSKSWFAIAFLNAATYLLEIIAS